MSSLHTSNPPPRTTPHGPNGHTHTPVHTHTVAEMSVSGVRARGVNILRIQQFHTRYDMIILIYHDQLCARIAQSSAVYLLRHAPEM